MQRRNCLLRKENEDKEPTDHLTALPNKSLLIPPTMRQAADLAPGIPSLIKQKTHRLSGWPVSPAWQVLEWRSAPEGLWGEQVLAGKAPEGARRGEAGY